MSTRNEQALDFFKRLLAVAGFVTAIAGALEVIFPDLPARFVPPIIAIVGGVGLTAFLALRSGWQISEVFGIWAIVLVLLLALYMLPNTVQGTIINTEGVPVGGVEVTIINANKMDASTPTDDNGRYVFTGVPEGDYTIKVGDQILYQGEILGRLERVITVFTVQAGSVALAIPEPPPTLEAMQGAAAEPTAPAQPAATAGPTPTLNIQRTAQSGCLDPLVCTLFPQADGGGAVEFNWYHEPGELVYEHTSACAYGDDQEGLRIRYAFTGAGNGGWGVHWSLSEARFYDASAFTMLQFQVKGAQGGERFDLGIKDDTGEVKITVNADGDPAVIPAEWIQMTVPLADFASINLSAIENVSFGFSRIHGTGEVCIDEIEFVK